MTQVSKYPISKDVYQQVFDIFLKTIANLRSKKEVNNFFGEFLTPTEQIMLAKRLAIGVLLAKEYEYREISRILRVSLTTIGSVSLMYKYRPNFRKVIENIIEDEKMEKYLLKLGENIVGVLSAGGSKSGSWRYLKSELAKKRRSKVF